MTATLSPAVDPDRPPKVRTKESASKSIFDPAIVKTASLDAFKKLNPRSMAKNPVMFIVEVGAVLTTVIAIAEPFLNTASTLAPSFTWGIAIWPSHRGMWR